MSVNQWEYSSQRVQWSMWEGQARKLTLIEFFKAPGLKFYSSPYPAMLNWTVAT